MKFFRRQLSASFKPTRMCAAAILIALAVGVSSDAKATEIYLANTPVVQAQGEYEVWSAENTGQMKFLRWKPTNIGDYITFRVNYRATTRNALRVYTTTYATNREGLYELYIDGQKLGPEEDLDRTNVWEHGKYPVPSGSYLVTYKLTGKNSKSGDTELTLDRFHIG